MLPQSKPKLPPKQEQFLAHYLANGLNATRAAIAAGYSARTADSQASRLLKNAKVKAELARRTKKALQKLEITAERTLEEIGKIAYLDPAEASEWFVEAKLSDKLKGLELLGRHFKMFTDKVEMTRKIERVVVSEAAKKHRPLPPSTPEF